MANSNHSLFEDIEQDNNPSLYGSQINAKSAPSDEKNVTNGKVGKNQGHERGYSEQNEFLQNSIVLPNTIARMINNRDLQIKVISSERLLNSSVIVYSIELSEGDEETKIIVKRRYSEFKSLRDNLARLFPLEVIPPVPEKHSLYTFLVSTLNNSKEQGIVDSRRRSFTRFLQDLIFESSPKLRNCSLFHKFLDPNYESCWSNAIHEPPIILVPDNLLLANPLNPTDQNGLYSLLPNVTGFDFDSNIDNLKPLIKFQEDLQRLNDQISFFEIRSHDAQSSDGKLDSNETMKFKTVPHALACYEENFHKSIKTVQDMNRINSRTSKSLKSIIYILVELGGNLNNFSLQIHELNSNNNDLSNMIEKFGSTIDSNFLSFESYLFNEYIPNWQEPTFMIIQYYIIALHLIKFYKYKLMQFKLLYKLKFKKYQELSSYTDGFENHMKFDNLKSLDIESPTLHEAIKQMELKQKRLKNRSLSSKKSWYGLFGGNKSGIHSAIASDLVALHSSHESDSAIGLPASMTRDEYDIGGQYRMRIHQVEKELDKLDQLIALTNRDMCESTETIGINFKNFLNRVEKKWLELMLDFLRCQRKLFMENLGSWNDLKEFLNDL